ncbi:MAG: 50S ribosomal protein L11 methyltransferase [Candidatus Latescibacteria bacterium]|nr:50S ribosomal protein L11 methyltransferase [Candidatus Latescibacterota bacterium]
MPEWTKITLDVPGDLSDLVSGLLFEAGTSGIQVEDGADRTHVRMSAYFERPEGRDAAMAALDRFRGKGAGIGPAATAAVPDERWGERWRESFQPVRVTDRIVVGPPWMEMTTGTDGMVIVLEPKMAFGTGRHESTRLALRAVERSVRADDRVLDLGTGSGILSIAAAKLGAGCLAVDVDPVAIDNARENLAVNGVADRVEVVCGSLDAVREAAFDVIVANIQTNVLVPLLGDLRDRLRQGGRLILSGILDREEEALREALHRTGWGSPEVLREGDWIGIVVERPV